MPKSEEEFRSKLRYTEEAWQFPCFWSAVDGCHIPINCPPGGLESCKEYHNFKNFFSVVLIGMVDSKYRFVWASCGYPGNSHDSIIFQSTDLWNQIKNQGYLPKIGKRVGSLLVPPLILGDAATVVDDAMHERQPYTTTKILQLPVELSQNGDGGCFWAT